MDKQTLTIDWLHIEYHKLSLEQIFIPYIKMLQKYHGYIANISLKYICKNIKKLTWFAFRNPSHKICEI